MVIFLLSVGIGSTSSVLVIIESLGSLSAIEKPPCEDSGICSATWCMWATSDVLGWYGDSSPTAYYGRGASYDSVVSATTGSGSYCTCYFLVPRCPKLAA